MMNCAKGDTVTTNKLLRSIPSTESQINNHINNYDNNNCSIEASPRTESNSVARKRRMTEQPLSKTPKTPRRGCEDVNDQIFMHSPQQIINASSEYEQEHEHEDEEYYEEDFPRDAETMSLENVHKESNKNNNNDNNDNDNMVDYIGNRGDWKLLKKPPMHPDVPRKRLIDVNRRDDTERLRKTVQWLEENARRLRQDLADARTELHEERRASRMIRREMEIAVKDARLQEAAKHQKIIAELKIRLSQSPTRVSTETSANLKAEFLKEVNHKRELSVAKKRLAEADETIRKLKSNSLDPGDQKKKRIRCLDDVEYRRMECEIRNLREANKRLEEKLQMVTEAERCRAVELRVQHEKHEAEMSALKKALRSDTIKMMDEIRAKDREIEKLEKLVKRKLKDKEDQLMRKLRESEKGQQIRLAPRIENKIPSESTMDLCKGDYENEVERLRELAMEQQEVIEYLRQALKERERKLDQLSNKKRKEEFYKQWLELEPVAEVDDEEEHEEGDSALSSAPSSLSPQPGNWQTNSTSNIVTREAYEALILEVDELQTKYLEEQQELAHAKSQVRELEKALLQETRGSQNSRRALSDKLKEAEEREAGLIAEMSELREQNELLEFRVLELEEAGPRESPDTADSGIVSPEPIQLFKEQTNKQRDRVVATVIPYNSYSQSMSPIPPQKAPLSLQESGIFDEEDDDEDDVHHHHHHHHDHHHHHHHQVELATCGTQTEQQAGELLQEVQRLQELRERIQERAAKVPVSVDISETGEENRLTPYKERIRELEERLEAYDEAEKKRIQVHLIAKQREEDLLDENYRLTEKVYWLENELHKPKVDTSTMTEKVSKTQENSTSTDFTITVLPFNNKPTWINDQANKSSLSRCQKIFHDALLNDNKLHFIPNKSDSEYRVAMELLSTKNECSTCETIRKDYDEKIQQLVKAECCLRRQMIDLECKERAFAKTLQQVDMTWSQLETDHAVKLDMVQRNLAEKNDIHQQMIAKIFNLENWIKNHHSCCDITRRQCDQSVNHKIGNKRRCAVDVVDNPNAYQVSGITMIDKENQTDEPMDVDCNQNERCGINRQTQTELNRSIDINKTESVVGNPSGDIITELAEETRERHEQVESKEEKGGDNVEEVERVEEKGEEDGEDEEEEKEEEVDEEEGERKIKGRRKGRRRKSVQSGCSVSRVHLQPEVQDDNAADAFVSINKSEAKEKVRKGQCRRRECDGWALRVWNATSSRNYVKSIVNLHRLVIYQETLCV